MTLINRLRAWLGDDGIGFFRRVRDEYGTLNAVWPEPMVGQSGSFPFGVPSKHNPDGPRPPIRVMPHPVHLREGISVRNWLRTQPETAGWTDHDYDDRWQDVVLRAINEDAPLLVVTPLQFEEGEG